LLSYFRRQLQDEIGKLRLANANLEANAVADKAVQQAKLKKRLDGVAQTSSGPRGGARNSRISAHDAARAAFETTGDQNG
jgi:hypothetical protein